MKVLLVALVILTGGFQTAVAFTTADAAERVALQRAPDRLGPTVSISADPALTDPVVTLAAVRAAAEAAGTNVFRTTAGYDGRGALRVTHFIYLTRATAFFRSLPLASGRPPTVAQSRSSGVLLSTTGGRFGRLADLGADDQVAVRTLDGLSQFVPVSGIYRAECDSGGGCEAFARQLAVRLSAIPGALPVTVRSLAGSGSVTTGQVDPPPPLQAVPVVLVFFTGVLAIYYQLREAKRAAVLRLHGMPAARVWFRVAGFPLVAAAVGALVLSLAVSALIPGATVQFLASVTGSLLLVDAVLLAASTIPIPYFVGLSLSAALKNRRDTVSLYVFNSGVRLVVSIAILVTAAGIVSQATSLITQRNTVGAWKQTAGYGVFYPTSVGNDLLDITAGQTGPTAAEVYELYPALDRAGGLYVDSTNFTPFAMKQRATPRSFPTMTVNPNYLAAFPVRDATGQKISISNSDPSWVVLVPERLRNREKAVRDFIALGRSPQSLASAEREALGGSVPQRVLTQQIKIIWTPSSQRVFAFNPLINPTGDGRIPIPIMQVITQANSTGLDRANAFSGGIDSAAKVKLRNGDPAATRASLQPELERLKLDDNLPYLVTLTEAQLQQVKSLDQKMLIAAAFLSALVVAFLVLTLQSLSLMFDRIARRVVVGRLFGHSLPRRYRSFLVTFVLIWMVQGLAAVGLDAVGVTPFRTASLTNSVGAATVLLTVLAAVIIDLIISLTVLRSFESRLTVTVLKEEF